jgi:hypothetical protein
MLDGMLRGTIGHVLMMAAINMADLGVLKQTASSIFGWFWPTRGRVCLCVHHGL